MVANANESPNLLSHEAVFIMDVMKSCYSLDIIHEGFNVPHFILASGESDGKAFLSRPLNSANIVNALEILTGPKNPVLPVQPNPPKELI